MYNTIPVSLDDKVQDLRDVIIDTSAYVIPMHNTMRVSLDDKFRAMSPSFVTSSLSRQYTSYSYTIQCICVVKANTKHGSCNMSTQKSRISSDLHCLKTIFLLLFANICPQLKRIYFFMHFVLVFNLFFPLIQK